MEYPFKDLMPLDEVLEREGYYKDWTHLDPEVFYSLTQISNFIKTKGYGVDVRLLIAQLAEHFGLKTTQVVDLGNLLTAKHAALKSQVEQAVSQVNADRNALETQFNQSVAQMQADKDAVIANATVDSEVILARGGKPTLQARLDDTTAQLAHTLTKKVVPIFLADRGMATSNTAAQNNAILTQAITDASVDNRPIIFPWTGNEYLELNTRCIVNAPIDISGFGDSTKLRHTVPATYVTNGSNALFDIRKGGTVRDLSIYGKSGFEGGVLLSGDNSKAIRVRVTNLLHGIRAMAYDFNNATKHLTPPKNMQAIDITSDYSCFPLLVEGSDSFYFRNIRGSYKIIGSRSPHLVYFSDGRNVILPDTTQPLGENINPVGEGAYATNGLSSCAFQFRYMRGGSINNLHAFNSPGLLNLTNSSNLVVKNISSKLDKQLDPVAGSNGIVEIGIEAENILIDGVSITNETGARSLFILEGTNNVTIKDFETEVKPSQNYGPGYYNLHLNGNGHKLINPIVTNKGTPWYTSIGVFGGGNHEVVNPRTSGDERAVAFREGGGENNQLLDYDLKNMGATFKTLEMLSPKIVMKEKYTSQKDLVAFDNGDKTYGSDDQFNQTTSGHAWIFGFGQWRILNGHITNITAANSSVYIDIARKNVDFSAGVKLMERESLILRVVDYLNFISIRLNHGASAIEIRKKGNEFDTVLASKTFNLQLGRRYEVRVKIFDRQIDVFIDGQLVVAHTLSVEDDALYTGTKFGLFGTGKLGEFDTIRWKNI